MSRLLKALAARDSAIRFRCEATGLDLVARAPTTVERIVASQHALKTAEGASLLAVRRAEEGALVAQCVLDDGHALGFETMAQLPGPLVTAYYARVQEALDAFDPDIDTITDTEYEQFREAVKKKATPASLTDFDISSLKRFIMHLVAELATCEMSKSSIGTCEESPQTNDHQIPVP